MHIPESLFPNRDLVGDSVEHFENGIEKMIQLINQIEVAFPTFTPIQKTRSLFATLEAGLSSIQGKGNKNRTVYVKQLTTCFQNLSTRKQPMETFLVIYLFVQYVSIL